MELTNGWYHKRTLNFDPGEGKGRPMLGTSHESVGCWSTALVWAQASSERIAETSIDAVHPLVDCWVSSSVAERVIYRWLIALCAISIACECNSFRATTHKWLRSRSKFSSIVKDVNHSHMHRSTIDAVSRKCVHHSDSCRTIASTTKPYSIHEHSVSYVSTVVD